MNKNSASDHAKLGRKNRRDTLVVIVVAVVLVTGAFFLVKLLNPGYSREPYQRQEYVLDDYVTITAYGKNQSQVEEAVDAAFQELFRIQSICNRYEPESEISYVNSTAADGAVAVSEELWEMISTAMEVYEASGGLFDVTVGPLVDLWDVSGRGARGEPPPGEGEVARAMQLVGRDKLVLDEAERSVFFLSQGMVIDLGGLAKGYALDRAADVLREGGVEVGVINMISTSMTMGDKPSAAEGPRWTIAITNPRGGDYLGTLSLPGGVYISTSGDYQRYFEYEGVRYHHIIDPRTGYPARGTMSATVIGGLDGAWSDALSTVLFITGYEEGLSWAEEAEEVEAIIVDDEGVVHTTSGVDQWAENLSLTSIRFLSRAGRNSSSISRKADAAGDAGRRRSVT
jgi:thiamine biosynthesis lipoprotein